MRKGALATLAVAAAFGGPGAGAAWADFLCPVVPISDQGFAQRAHWTLMSTSCASAR